MAEVEIEFRKFGEEVISGEAGIFEGKVKADVEFDVDGDDVDSDVVINSKLKKSTIRFAARKYEIDVLTLEKTHHSFQTTP